MSDSNIYNNLYSKVRRIYIQLPNFKFFHRPSGLNDVDSHFVERKRIIAILKDWLDDKNGNHTGSYLITGYRGMGKTSFVGKVIDEMVEKQREIGFRRRFLNFFYSFIKSWKIEKGGSIGKALDARCKKSQIKPFGESLWKIGVNVFALLPAICIFINIISTEKYCLAKWILIAIYFVLFVICSLWCQCKKNRIPYILNVKINISNEVANARDVMSLIACSIRNGVCDYLEKKTAILPLVLIARLVRWTVIMIVVSFLYNELATLLQPAADAFYTEGNKYFLSYVSAAVNRVFYEFPTNYRSFTAIAGGLILISVVYALRRVAAHFLLSLSEYFGKAVRTPRWFVMQLDDICNRIDAEVKENNDPYNMSFWGLTFSFMHKASKQYRQASTREIELALINIIEKIHKSWILNCRLIVILDELDKLNRFDSEDKTENVAFPEFTSNENGVAEDSSQQDKKHRILSLLGQLKYFINTAKAKFIFIAGHELYDAYLADVSDREYSISSIFHGVINVDSFFTCDSRTKDITKLTEIYLCKQLMGSCKQKQEQDEAQVYNLAEYRKSVPANLQPQERDKVVVFLRQFITYLTFVSNGAPKKLAAHFEKYVISKEAFEEREKQSVDTISEPIVLRIKPNKQSSFYLSFGYYEQQKIGFIHYLACPIFENIISPSSEYGDKLLIASSFLIAHIYKHHNSGFSWRNLEYLPELIDSNRTPELREFINSIIGYLGQIHLTTITSGIYTYKFPMRLVEEISIFTKKSEELSAIFNFSLDYSLAVKKYYYRLLDFYRQKQDSSEVVMASLRHNIGDIHMANDEYTEAIVQFRQITDSIEKRMRELEAKAEVNMASLIVRYMRIMLKLGLAYEKRNTIDSAYLVYSSLMAKLIAHREIHEESLGLRYEITKEENDEKYIARNFWQNRRIILLPSESYRDKNDFCRTCYPKLYDKKEDNVVPFWIYGDELTDNLCDFLTPNKEALITKLSVYEDLRMAYQPILAKLFALEKYNICGITKDNVRVAEAEFQYMYLITNSRDKYLLQVDFYRKLGDILYYKNNWFFTGDRNSAITLLSCWGYDLKNAVFDYCYRKDYSKSEIEAIMKQIGAALKLRKINTIEKFVEALSQHAPYDTRSDIREIVEQIPRGLRVRIEAIVACGKRRNALKNIPCAACRYYDRSLDLLKVEMIEWLNAGDEKQYDKCSKVFLFLDAVYDNGPGLVASRYNNLTQIALTLDAMGNALFSCALKKDEIDVDFLNDLFGLQSEKERSKILRKFRKLRNDNEKKKIHFRKILLYFWTAMKYHEKAGNNKESVQCLLKIMKIMMAAKHTIKYQNLNVERVGEVLSAAINKLYSTRMFYNIKEVKKLREIIHEDDNQKINLSLSSIMPEVEELLLAYYEILLEQAYQSGDKNAYLKLLETFYGSPSLSRLRSESLTYNRVVSLLFKAKLNERLFEELGFQLFESPQKNECQAVFDRFDSVDEQKVKEIIQECLHAWEDNKQYEQNKNELLEFLIADSIFCLMSITDFILPPARTTLFTNSFCQSVYERLFHWIRWKEAYALNTLNQKLDQLIEVHHREMLKPTYLKEMANLHCAAAREMQHEGDDYQDFIKGLYLLDDDLQNNTCQFYFALERYKINSGMLKKIEIALEDDYYKPVQYF